MSPWCGWSTSLGEYRNTTDVFFNEHSADEEKEGYIDRITPQDATRPRMFREEYSFCKRNRKINKCVDFYVARVRDPMAQQTQTEEISDFCWLSLDQVADRLTYDEDRALFQCVKQAILSQTL